MLHIAPERALAREFRKNFDYLSIDLDGDRAMMAMDVTGLEFPDASFDVIICSHVLEHVPDDRNAMTELFRVMRPGGWGVIQVPINGQTTHEDRTITNPDDRIRLFGQEDHVRQYGRDVIDRLADAGFTVECYETADWPDQSELDRLSVACENEIILVRRGDR